MTRQQALAVRQAIRRIRAELTRLSDCLPVCDDDLPPVSIDEAILPMTLDQATIPPGAPAGLVEVIDGDIFQ
jgi:hypothetical protein